jgi:hypothetical protein
MALVDPLDALEGPDAVHVADVDDVIVSDLKKPC